MTIARNTETIATARQHKEYTDDCRINQDDFSTLKTAKENRKRFQDTSSSQRKLHSPINTPSVLPQNTASKPHKCHFYRLNTGMCPSASPFYGWHTKKQEPAPDGRLLFPMHYFIILSSSIWRSPQS